ncbi:MAG: FkbM family methyltransferase [Clostridiales bacterium]|jgi:FkbM family methyltransferase|nr:FkbM family methyltransferase [Clostridiales bacterium]
MKRLLKNIRTRFHNDIHQHLIDLETSKSDFNDETLTKLGFIEQKLQVIYTNTSIPVALPIPIPQNEPERITDITRLLDRESVPVLGEGSSISFSQLGQDKIVETMFIALGIRRPITYLDVGANHPIGCSNTALFYSRGGKGVAVEANPNYQEMWHTLRPRDTFVNAAVVNMEISGGEVELNLIDGDDFSQLSYVGDRSHIAEYFGKTSSRKITVPAYTLNLIVDRFCSGEFPDYLSLDIEGYDFDVLKATDFSRSFPKIISIEDRTKELGDVFRQKGFVPLICICDTFAIHESLLNSGDLQLFKNVNEW